MAAKEKKNDHNVRPRNRLTKEKASVQWRNKKREHAFAISQPRILNGRVQSPDPECLHKAKTQHG